MTCAAGKMPAGQIEAKSLDAELPQAIYRPWDALHGGNQQGSDRIRLRS